MHVAAVIPHYNHDRQIESVLTGIAASGIPAVIVDDGSHANSLAALKVLLVEYPDIQLIAREHNGGKGAAVMHGCRALADAGFSHALQIDADGQHACEDMPALLDLAQQYPEAIISGAPRFDDDMPFARRFGRHLTHFFVMLETLSRRVGDSMCGFRVYPLTALTQLIDSTEIGERMDFDIEVMVRADWAGVAIHHVPTRVQYPEDGASHFHYLRDNLSITRLHTRLMFGMLWRSPHLVRRWFG